MFNNAFHSINSIIEVLDSINFSFGKHSISIWDLSRNLLTVLIAILVYNWIIRSMGQRISNIKNLDSNLKQIILRSSKIIIFIIVALITLQLIGIDITAFSVIGGAVGVGIGFGLQKIASNFLSGFIILADRSVKVGDRIVLDNNAGKITEITMRYVVMERFDGTEVLIPNETFITNSIQNQSYSSQNLRSDITCVIGSRNDINVAMEQVKNIIQSAPDTIPEQASLQITRLVDDGVEVKGFFWVSNPANSTTASNYIYVEINKLIKSGVILSPQPNQRIQVLK